MKKTKMKLPPRLINRTIIISMMLLVTSGGIAALPWEKAQQELLAQTKEENNKTENSFTNMVVVADSALVMDALTGKIIFAKNINKQLPLASITKVMTALVASEINQPDTIITVNAEALKEGSNAGLTASTWYLKDLLDFSLVTSSNGGARAIAAASKKTSGQDFIKQMNDKAINLGLSEIYFINPTGLDVGREYGGSYGTAHDVAKLFQFILNQKPDLLIATKEKSIQRQTVNQLTYTGINTNKLVGEIPGLIASKTGFTDNAGGNLAIAFDAGLRKPYIVVVLASTKENRFVDVKKLVQATIEYQAIK